MDSEAEQIRKSEQRAERKNKEHGDESAHVIARRLFAEAISLRCGVRSTELRRNLSARNESNLYEN